MKKQETFWCIWNPNTRFLPWTMSTQRNGSIQQLRDVGYDEPWSKLYKKGYRCVKVLVKEIK